MKHSYTWIVILFCITILSLNLISASDMTYQKGKDIDLKVPCVLNDSACTISVSCTLTINYPDGTNLIKGESTINNLDYQNYTLDGINITQLGKYQVIMFCDDGINKGYTLDSFEVTTTGATNEFLINLAIFIFLIFSIVLVVVGLNKQDPIIIILSSMLFIFAGFWAYYNPIAYFPSFINLALSLVCWGLGVYFMIATAITFAGDDW
jgi:hypothetical protein